MRHTINKLLTLKGNSLVGRVLNELKLEKTELATVGYNNLMTIVEQTCNDSIQLFYDLQRYNPHAHLMRLRLKRPSIWSTLCWRAR